MPHGQFRTCGNPDQADPHEPGPGFLADLSMLLNILYLVVAVVALPWVVWRRLSGGRPVAAPWQRFFGRVAVPLRERGVARIWLHGVSVGEVQLLASLGNELDHQARAAGRRIECVISSSTTTGLEVATKRFGPGQVFPCPLDFTWAVGRVFQRLRPDLLVLGELELWPNLLAAAWRRRIPVVIANARMSEQSFAGYRRVSGLAAGMLGKITLVSARSQADAERFSALGAADVRVAGSMKFDSVRGERQAPEVERLRALAGIAPGDTVFLAGSTQSPEERLAAETFRALRDAHPALRLIIVPRHVERAGEIASMLDGLGLVWEARSRLERDRHDPAARVLLVDSTGELSWWWGTASIAFVGGSLDGSRGGQNMLEPAAYGNAVSFGPHTRNFRDEVAGFLQADAAVVVADGPALTDFVARCLEDPAWADGLGQRAAALVAAQRGATAVTARLILDQIPALSPEG
jgi:3-deoxy-D-manno-octulosonic-acid transferase